VGVSDNQKESEMNATALQSVVGVDISKNVFELAVADGHWRVIEWARLTRSQFERWFAHRAVDLVVMEACGSAHHWARWLSTLSIEVRLLPARYVRAYVKRNKTDAADAAALLEAARASDIVPVRIKSVEQQALQALASHPLAVDGYAYVAHQCAAWILSRVRYRDRRRQPHGPRTNRPCAGRSALSSADATT